MVPIAGVELDSDDDSSTSDFESWRTSDSAHYGSKPGAKRVEIGAKVTIPTSTVVRRQAPVILEEAARRPPPQPPSPDAVFEELDYKRTQDGLSTVQPLYVEAVPYSESVRNPNRVSQKPASAISSAASRTNTDGETSSEATSRRRRPVEKREEVQDDSYRMALIEKVALLSLIVVVTVVVGTACGVTRCGARSKTEGTLQTIKQRGKLRCGVADFELMESPESKGLSQTMVRPC